MTRYQVLQRSENGLTAYHLIDRERRAEAVLYPELGNNCVEFRTTPDPDGLGANGSAIEPVDLFMPPDPLENLRQSPAHGGQPILFPFPNRVRDGIYTFEGRTYRMEKLLKTGRDHGAGHAIHGLAGDKPWTVEETQADDQGAVIRSSLTLNDFPDIVEQYPFPCRITITYRLREGLLHLHVEVANTGAEALPMGFGIHPWHPAALRPGKRLPAALAEIDAERRGRSMVKIPAAAIWRLERLMPTGEIAPVEQAGEDLDLREFRPLDGHYYDHVYTQVQRRDDGWSEGGVRDPETGLEMYLTADAAFREWVCYAPERSPVVALEPYTCTTDAVNLEARGVDAGLIALPAGQTWRGEIRFGLRRIPA